MHSQRLLVAAAFIPLFVGLTAFLPERAFLAFLAAGAILALWEWAAVSAQKGWSSSNVLTVAAGMGFFAAAGRGDAEWLLPALFAALAVLLAAALCGKGVSGEAASMEARLHAFALSFAGAAYVGLGVGVQMPIRMREDGVALVFFLYLVTAAGDIGAYYVGKAVGKHKMAPEVSPNKTWEGSAGHVAASIGAAALAKVWFCGAFAWWEIFALGVLMSAVGQMGDLSISLLKRATGVKDTGTLLPGHGGVLDRADAFLLTGPALWLWLAFAR